MKSNNPSDHQMSFLCSTLKEMLDSKETMYQLADHFPWEKIEEKFGKYYSEIGRPAKPIRLMVSLLLLKHIDNLSDESVVRAWKLNPYYQYLSGEIYFQNRYPIEPTDLVHFRNRIGVEGAEFLLGITANLFGEKSREEQVVADTTVQEKNITFPTDVKLSRQVIERCWKIAATENVRVRQSYKFKVKKLLGLQRLHRSRVSDRQKVAIKAERHLRTIGRRLVRELNRTLSEKQLKKYGKDLELCYEILYQKRSDTEKIYSLHAPEVYCISKGKAHKRYEFGSKVSILQTATTGIIVGALSFEKNVHDSYCLEPALEQRSRLVGGEAGEILTDKGYQGIKKVGEAVVTMPSRLKKGLSYYWKQKLKRKMGRRSAIEPAIGHMKQENRLGRNYLKGVIGDQLNVVLAASGYNLRKWMRCKAKKFFFVFILIPIGNLLKAFSQRRNPFFAYSSSNEAF
jgi:IS5 family transposase